MTGTKSAVASVTVWGGAAAVLAGIAHAVFGFTVSAEDQAVIANDLATAASIIGGLVAIWGRVRATKQVALTKAR